MKCVSSFVLCFFFSSRRRHTRCSRDWSSDVCSSDLDLDFHLGQEVDDVFRTAIEFGVSLLPAETLGFGDRDALQSDFLKRLFYLVELEWLDDGFNLLH